MTTTNESVLKGKRVWITGHRGMLGQALVRALRNSSATLLLVSREELDLHLQSAVTTWVRDNCPDFVLHVGAKVGGIVANRTFPADFIYDNLMIEANVIHAAHLAKVHKLIFVSSNCTYPAEANQPIAEDALLSGPLEANIRSYAVGKIAGMELCRAYRRQFGDEFISAVPPNLYGPGDNYHPEYGHVVAGILRRTHEAKYAGLRALTVWGDGTARRELLYVDDLATALVALLTQETTHDVYNVGAGRDIAIAELAQLIMSVVGFEGDLDFDKSRPNGTMRKLLDSSRINSLGWRPAYEERRGLMLAYQDFLERTGPGVVP